MKPAIERRRAIIKPLLFDSGRRFLFVWVALAIAAVALFIKFATFAEWASFAQWLGGIYIVANVGEKFAEGQNGKANGTPPAAPAESLP